MTTYYVGSNDVGYLPNPDAVTECATAPEAIEQLRDLLAELRDHYAEQCGDWPTDEGSEHCEWCSVALDVEAALVAMADGDIAWRLDRDGGVTLRFSPPEYADVAYFIITREEKEQGGPTSL